MDLATFLPSGPRPHHKRASDPPVEKHWSKLECPKTQDTWTTWGFTDCKHNYNLNKSHYRVLHVRQNVEPCSPRLVSPWRGVWTQCCARQLATPCASACVSSHWISAQRHGHIRCTGTASRLYDCSTERRKFRHTINILTVQSSLWNSRLGLDFNSGNMTYTYTFHGKSGCPSAV